MAFDRHQWNDYAPYAYVTRDYGKTWRSIGAGLGSYVHVVREDPRNGAVLFAGTERGVFVSFDSGAHWIDLRLGMPHVPVFDLQIHPRDNDLILGTHGRGFYILDDLTPLEHWSGTAQAATLFAPMPAVRYSDATYREHGRGAFVSENKPYGALLTLYLATAPPPAQPKAKPSVHVRVLDAAGKQIDAFDANVHAGLNRFAWDLRTQPSPAPTQDARPYYIFYPMTISGPQVLPGTYTVEVQTGGARLREPVTVMLDPHNNATNAQLQAQYDALMSLAAAQSTAERDIAQLQQAQSRIGDLHKGTLTQERGAVLTRLASRIDGVLATLRNPEPSGYRKPARLSEQLAYLRSTIDSYDGPPTQPQDELIRRFEQEGAAADAEVTSIVNELRALQANR